MKVVAIIPARAGSKGIPNKNLISVAGKPLIQWTIEAALHAQKIDCVVVTSDGQDILKFAKNYSEVTIIDRPKELAQDHSPTAPVIAHALKALGTYGEAYESLILLQPTSPLRNQDDIDKAIEQFENSEATALISVTEPDHHPLKSFKTNEKGYLEGLINNEYPFMPRQELPKVYQPNGAIYIIDVDAFSKNGSFFTDRTVAFEMSKKKSIDIDSMADIQKVETYVNS